jgi:hypothetical protein
VFESGAVDPAGMIRGNDGDRDPQRFEPHFDEIRSSDEVQICESVMATQAGMATTGLLQAVGYLKTIACYPRDSTRRPLRPTSLCAARRSPTPALSAVTTACAT